MIEWHTFFASIWKFRFKFRRSFCQRIFYNWSNRSCIVCSLFAVFFCNIFYNFSYIAWTIFKFVTYFWSFFSMHIKIQYCIFAFYFVRIKMKSKLFLLKNEMLTSLTIILIFSKLIIFQIFSIMNHCFINLNDFSWFFWIRMRTKRRFKIESFMIKKILKINCLNTFEKKKWFECDINVLHCRSRFNMLMINFCKFFLLPFCFLNIVIKRFSNKIENYVLI